MNTTTFTNAFADYSITDKKELRRGRVIRAILSHFGTQSFTISELRHVLSTPVFAWVSLTHEVNSKYVREQFRSLIKSLDLVKVGSKNTGKGGRMENAYTIQAERFSHIKIAKVATAKTVAAAYQSKQANFDAIMPNVKSRMKAIMFEALTQATRNELGQFDTVSLLNGMTSEISKWKSEGVSEASIKPVLNDLIKQMGFTRVGSQSYGRGRPAGVYAVKMENLTEIGLKIFDSI